MDGANNMVKKIDGRSNPCLRDVPLEKQRYILRKCTQGGMYKIAGFKFCPIDVDIRRTLIKYHEKLRELGGIKGKYALLSCRPRPKHVATYEAIIHNGQLYVIRRK